MYKDIYKGIYKSYKLLHPSSWTYNGCVVRKRSCNVACITTWDYIVATVVEYVACITTWDHIVATVVEYVACITTWDYIVATVVEYCMRSKLMSPSPVCLASRNLAHRPYHTLPIWQHVCMHKYLTNTFMYKYLTNICMHKNPVIDTVWTCYAILFHLSKQKLHIFRGFSSGAKF